MTYKITHIVHKGHKQLLKPPILDVTVIEVFKAKVKKKWLGKKTHTVYERIAKYYLGATSIQKEDEYRDSIEMVEQYLKDLGVTAKDEADHAFTYGEDWSSL